MLVSPAFAEEIEAGFVPLFDGQSLPGWQSARSKGDNDWGPFSVNKEEQAIYVYADAEAKSKQQSDCLNTEEDFVISS